MATTVLEQCSVVPPPDAAAIEQSLPLVHFDMILLRANPLQTQDLLFYKIPCSKSEFLESIVPKLKTSLSLALNHFLPLAGKIHFPLTSPGRPISRYTKGDSLSLTIAETSADFVHLAGNHSRNADDFQYLAPQLPPSDYSSLDFVKIPLLAVQVTYFPNKGICIGFNTNHAIGDGTTTLTFTQAWACLTQSSESNIQNYLPFYDRSGVEDPNGLDSTCWNMVKSLKPTISPSIVLFKNYVHVTLAVNEAEIIKLKNLAMEKKPDLAPVSSFTVLCALLWICSVKSAEVGDDDDDEAEYFVFPVDCRTRLDPPLPCTYFGNCVVIVRAKSTHGRLKGDGGFVNGVDAIKEAIDKTVHNEKGILDGIETRWLEHLDSSWKKRAQGVSGSPRFDYYGVDFGWGRPLKVESFRMGAICLSSSRDFASGMEVGLWFPKLRMDSFVAIFNHALGRDSENVLN